MLIAQSNGEIILLVTNVYLKQEELGIGQSQGIAFPTCL